MDRTNDTGLAGKICSLDRLLALREEAAARGERVVHCHGCFDIVHPGHVRHLQHARDLGDRLIVTITADAHVNKGDSRPLFMQDLRAENLAALSCVDHVCVNDSPTAVDLLDRLRPDIYIKGAEYEGNQDPRFLAERDAVERHGGRVVFTSGDVVFSSTALINAMGTGSGDGIGHAEDPEAATLRRLRQSHGLTSARVGEIIAQMRDKRLVIVGETIIDTYVECAWPDVTTEAPMLTLRPRRRVSFDGGAAVIARHAAALGAKPVLVTPLPRSVEAEALCERLENSGVEVQRVPMDAVLPEKERFLVGRDKLVKMDRSEPIELDARTRTRMVDIAGECARGADAAVVTDFGLGLFNPRAMIGLFRTLRERVGVLAGDVSGSRATLLAMKDADWLTPSERELRGALGEPVSSLPAVVVDLMHRTGARGVTVTMAEDGLVNFTPKQGQSFEEHQSRLASEHVPALNKIPMDVLGCGDALLATGSLALACGVGLASATFVGSLAAATCAARLGNPTLEPRELTAIAQRVELAQPGVRLRDRADEHETQRAG